MFYIGEPYNPSFEVTASDTVQAPRTISSDMTIHHLTVNETIVEQHDYDGVVADRYDLCVILLITTFSNRHNYCHSLLLLPVRLYRNTALFRVLFFSSPESLNLTNQRLFLSGIHFIITQIVNRDHFVQRATKTGLFSFLLPRGYDTLTVLSITDFYQKHFVNPNS